MKIKCLTLILLMIIPAGSAFAHDPGLSYVEMSIDGNKLSAGLTFSRAEFESINRSIDAEPDILKALRAGTIIRVDGVTVAPTQVTRRHEQSNEIRFDLNYDLPPGAIITYESTLIGGLQPGHRQFATITVGGESRLETILSAADNRIEYEMAQSGRAGGAFTRFLLLGVEHIVFGFDHLAFLAALLLGVGGFRGALKIVTAFTVAHSMTLALAVFDVMALPAWFVEPVIAASIVYVALENLFRREMTDRWPPAFAFGLIHGFGFASALKGLGIAGAGTGAIIPLLSFNSGVEIGQIGLTAIVLPVLIRLRNRPAAFGRLIRIGSVILGLSGLFWLSERVFS